MNGFHFVEPPEPVTEIVGGVIRRSYRIPAGMSLFGHVHDYDHLSILFSGKARLLAGEEMSEIAGPHMLVIKAGVEHTLLALTDCVWDCLHSFQRAHDAHERGDPYALLGVRTDAKKD